GRTLPNVDDVPAVSAEVVIARRVVRADRGKGLAGGAAVHDFFTAGGAHDQVRKPERPLSTANPSRSSGFAPRTSRGGTGRFRRPRAIPRRRAASSPRRRAA